jgi:hypothetical protein
MKRKRYMIGIAVAAVILLSVPLLPSYCRLVTSAQTFQRSYREFSAAKSSLNPFERAVLSLLMAGKQAQQPKPGRS